MAAWRGSRSVDAVIAVKCTAGRCAGRNSAKSKHSGRVQGTNNRPKAAQIIVIEIGNGGCASVQRQWSA